MKEEIIAILIDHQPKDVMNDGSIAGFVQHTEYGLIAYEIEQLVNPEVEKRIAERMPSEEEINKQAEQAMQRDTKDGRIGIIIDSTYYGVFCDALEWLRSRLTCSEKPNNTEGGE